MLINDVRHCNECVTVIAALPVLIAAGKHTISVVTSKVKGPRK